jgi:type VI secretion system secreted protein Hcp
MAIDAFLKIDGVKGESVVKGHAGEIDVLSWSWGMSQSGTTHLGTGGGAGKVDVQDLSFTHYVDSSAPNLMQACCTGKHYDEALLVLRKAGTNPLDYITITLKNVIITSISTGGSGGEEMVTENVTLNFNEFTYAYQPQDKTGAAKGGAIETAYKIAENA